MYAHVYAHMYTHALSFAATPAYLISSQCKNDTIISYAPLLADDFEPNAIPVGCLV